VYQNLISISYEKKIESQERERRKRQKKNERERQERDKERQERERKREFEREKLNAENYRIARENERPERDRLFELEKLKFLHESEIVLVRSEFDGAKNIRFVPIFQEKVVVKYFPQFEKVAANLKWPKEYWSIITKRMNWKGGGSLLSASHS
jgi:hypothetical protein